MALHLGARSHFIFLVQSLMRRHIGKQQPRFCVLFTRDVVISASCASRVAISFITSVIEAEAIVQFVVSLLALIGTM